MSLLLVGEEEKGVDSDEDAVVAEPGAPGVSPSGQPGKKDSKKLVRTTRKRTKALANKPQDFQVRVLIAKCHIRKVGELLGL